MIWYIISKLFLIVHELNNFQYQLQKLTRNHNCIIKNVYIFFSINIKIKLGTCKVNLLNKIKL